MASSREFTGNEINRKFYAKFLRSNELEACWKVCFKVRFSSSDVSSQTFHFSKAKKFRYYEFITLMQYLSASVHPSDSCKNRNIYAAIPRCYFLAFDLSIAGFFSCT